MRPLTLDDLLPLAEFAGRRREFFGSMARYLDRYRRVRIGPLLTLLFENRQTLWFRVQELLRITRLADPARVQQELDLYNRLLPGRDELQAALVLSLTNEGHLPEELATWQNLRGEALCLRCGDQRWPAVLVTCRPEDLVIGMAHWVRFSVPAAARGQLADFRLPARFEVDHPGYQQESALLSEEVRQSLLDDLELSDRD
jgi:hypothetical protein